MKNLNLKNLLGILVLSAAAGVFISPQTHADDTTAPAADNTAVNTENGNSTLTADQAKNNVSDREIMRKIRRAVIADKSLSTYGHNVKIIATGGQVTLKGTVHTQAEKDAIGDKAAAVVGAEHVTNSIQIKGS